MIFLDSLGGVEVALGGVTPRKKEKNMKREAEVAQGGICGVGGGSGITKKKIIRHPQKIKKMRFYI